MHAPWLCHASYFLVRTGVCTQVPNGCRHMAGTHTCDTRVGNSGSPLFQPTGSSKDDWVVRALHFAGLLDRKYNLAIPIDDELFQWLDCYRLGNPVCLPASYMLPLV